MQKRMRKIVRHPRYPEGQEIAALSQLMWQSPSTTVQIDKSAKAVEFRFRIAFPKDLRSVSPVLWNMFLGAGAEDWRAALERAYWTYKSGRRELHKSVSQFLRRVYRNALCIWLDNTWQFDKKQSEEQAAMFRADSEIKRQQPDPWLSMRLAKTFDEFKIIVTGLRKQLKRRARLMKQADLEGEIRACIPLETLVAALRQVTGDQRADLRVFFQPGISVTQLAEALTKALADAHRVDLRRISIQTHIRKGKKLTAALVRIPGGAVPSLVVGLVPTPH